MSRPRKPFLDWPQVAAALTARFPRARLHPAVLAWAREDRGAGERAPRPWAVAFSGGADSLALLLLLWAHWPEERARLVALHFNHRLRGRASRADAAFCRKVCASLGIELVSGEWREARKGASEAQAREARFDFFGKTLVRRRIRALWLGHQQDDIAETALMRLARGSGAAGLAAPHPVKSMPFPPSRVHLRPLLTLKKRELVAALAEVGAFWREDASNATGDYLRNRIRREVLPAWMAADSERDALAGAALSRELLDEDDAALEAWLETLAPIDVHGRLRVKALAGKPRAILRRALHRWLGLQRDTGDLSRQGFELLLAAVEKGASTRFSLGRRGFAVIRQGVMFFERNTARASSRRKQRAPAN